MTNDEAGMTKEALMTKDEETRSQLCSKLPHSLHSYIVIPHFSVLSVFSCSTSSSE